jgi:hypothetical protein
VESAHGLENPRPLFETNRAVVRHISKDTSQRPNLTEQGV